MTQMFPDAAVSAGFGGQELSQPVLDDRVGSRWTLTAAGWLLLSNGSGPVWPFALVLGLGAGAAVALRREVLARVRSPPGAAAPPFTWWSTLEHLQGSGAFPDH